MKKLLVITMILSTQMLWGQNIQDALRMSNQSYFSSARMAGLGGAFGAMGADFGTISYNPAAVGSYYTNEFSIGFSSTKTKSEALLIGENEDYFEDSSHRRLKLENAGIVFFSNPSGDSWKSSNFSFGINRTANFDQELYYEGTSKGSFTDRFLERANGKELSDLDDFEAGLAWDVGAIYDPDDELYYKSDYQSFPNNKLDKNQVISSRGGINEMSFAYGANYNDKFIFGISFGVPFLNYTEEKTYTEKAIDANSYLQNLEYSEYLSTSGVGFNFKGGFIAKLNKQFRLGASVHSPTLYVLQDDYYTELLYEYDLHNGGGLESSIDGSPDGNFRYQFTTPWRYTGSVGSVFRLNEVGLLLDAEFEYTDFSTGSFDFTEYSTAHGDEVNEKFQNKSIKDNLKPAMTYKLGVELAYKKVRGRLGYVLPETPFDNDELEDATPSYTFGLGYRDWNYYIDLALVNQRSAYGYSPYELLDDPLETLAQPFVVIDKYRTKWMLTFGRKF